MLKRLAVGFLKGLVVGAAVGAGLYFGLGWPQTPGLLGYLVAMGAGGTAGLLTGRPPWQQEAWIEGLLKAVAGVGVGALLYWLGLRFAAVGLPLGLPGVPKGTPWLRAPLLFAPAVAALYGALVELDNTDGGAQGGAKNQPRNRKKPSADDPGA